ncbi:MAG TPA: hypothetical protein VF739_06330 [Ktedonobacterales bacterium]
MNVATTGGVAAEDVTAQEGQASQSVFHPRNLLMIGVLFITALVTLLILQVVIGISPLGISGAPHFVLQAESFLQGRWDLMLSRPIHDTIQLHGRYYIVYPPFPALVMLPFVAIFGGATSDIFITTVVAALNLPLFYTLLEQARANGLTRRSPRENLIISLFLYFGSINLYLSLGGEVWFTAQIVGFTCTLAALLLAFRRHFGWGAALMGCAFFSRGTLGLGFPLMLYLAWQDGGTGTGLQRFAVSLWRRAPAWRAIPWARLLPPLAVFVGVVGLFLLRDALIFGTPFESGYGLMNQQNYPEIKDGLYSLHYVYRNVVAMFFDFPRISFSDALALNPVIDLIGDGQGMSVFVTTPLFLFLFARNRRISPLRIALLVTIALCVIQALLFCATGWYQFGARYLFDAYPFAFLLLALNERRIDWRFVALGVFGIGINLVGAGQFWR